MTDHLETLRNARPSIALANTRSEKGAKTLTLVLAASRAVFVREGHAGLSLRKVAAEAGVASGNVSYYFRSKRDLLEATLREELADYAERHLSHFESSEEAPIEILTRVVRFYVSSSRTNYGLFFQMWGYAASDPNAKALVRELYRPIGRFIYYLVRAARPDASDKDIRRIVLQIFSLEEGAKLFIGMGPVDDMALRQADDDIPALARKIVLDGAPSSIAVASF
jgi:AcrR family transcriptional regulator